MTSLRTHVVYNIVKEYEDDKHIHLCLDNGEETTTMLELSKTGKTREGRFGMFCFIIMAQRGNKYVFTTHDCDVGMIRYYFLTLNDDTVDIWTYVLPKFDSPHFGPLDLSAPYSFQTFLNGSWASL